MDETIEPWIEAALSALSAHVARCRAGEGPVSRLRDVSELERELEFTDFFPAGAMDPDAFGAFIARYLAASTRLQHPGFLAHQVAVPHPVSAAIDLVNGTINNGMAVFEMGPPAVALERASIRWFLAKIGWESGDGVLTHGGSMANLTALLAARARACPDAWKTGTPPDLAVLAPKDSHYSIARAVAIAGLGSDAIEAVPTDALGRLDPSALPAALDAARNRGRRPIALIANSCATASGLYDDLHAAGEFAREHGLWFHVDAAHGAAALLSPKHRHRLRGVELADSLTWDAHKMLRTSVLCAAVLFRDPETVHRIFSQDASYLGQSIDEERPNLFSRAIECTKTGLGLKLVAVVAALGEDGLAAHVDHTYDLARRFHGLISSKAGFECPYEPESNILCFRWRAGDDEEQERIRLALLDQGDTYLSSAVLGGRRYLRMAIMNEDTNEAIVEHMLDRIEEMAS